MEIKFKLFGLTDIVDDNEASVVLAGGHSLKDALEELARKYGDDFRERLFDSNGRLRDHIRLVIDGTIVEKAEEKIEGDTTVFILHEIAGG